MPSVVDDGGTFGPSGLWALAGSRLYLSTDFGTTWVAHSRVTGSTLGAGPNVFSNVEVLDADHAWSATAGPGSTPYDGQGPLYDHLHIVISRTTGGGRTWRSVTLLGDWEGTQPVLAFADALHGYLLLAGLRFGGPGAVFATADGGVTWQRRTVLPQRLGAIVGATDAQTLWAGNQGDAGPVARPILDVSRDGGRTWADARLPGLVGDIYVNDTLVAPPVIAGETGAVAVLAETSVDPAAFLVFRTTDGGHTWVHAASIPDNDQVSVALAVIDATHLVALDPVAGVVRSTGDGGATWQTSPMRGLGSALWIRFWDPGHGVAMSQAGDSASANGLFTTSDGGQTWLPVSFTVP